MLRLWAFGLMLTGLTFVLSGCGGEDSKAPEGGVAAPGSPALPGAADAGIDVAKKQPKR
ncbi:hypothetical protein SAMN05444166_3287 [Singulisphaera sp. GP187]|uniref:hypothetical protein n=1 Tax=Singulisphaera sp. GP187 TaxID=1882752 RepID=UPI0009296DF0|nr:hypothetical protein [Singulisphaera sp. GP187]SIO25757.1 hypothetical protein SAMN05444166_3287 [Singulisphaera sp. GP187]